MTERHILESSIGLAGRLSHLPYRTGKAEDCGWQSSRDFSQNAPIFKVFDSWTTWFPATEAPGSHVVTGTLWNQRRRQQRWLLKSHPEARLGNEVVNEHLLEAASRHDRQGADPCHTSHFALGELTDTSKPRGSTGAPLLVTSAGIANDEIRFVKPNLAEWRWGEEDSGALRLAERSAEEPAFWTKDIGPICQLKCFVDLKRYDPTRWLVVQRCSGTRVFQPEYQRVPTTSTQSGSKEPSRIAPNPILYFSRDQTGGNSHTDVAFNPGTRSRPPQLGIIDKCGFWSIWDITLTRIKTARKPKSKLKKCGHIQKGVTEQFPSREASVSQWHKILWVGCSDSRLEELQTFGFDENQTEPSSQYAFLSLERSTMLLLCNSSLVRLLDTTTNSFLPDLSFLRPGSSESVLDIHANPQDPQYCFVLTTSKLFLVRVFSEAGEEWDKPQMKWTILLSSPHFRDTFDKTLKLTVTPGVKSLDQVTSMVFIYSAGGPLLDLFCVRAMKKDPDRATCHHETVNLAPFRGSSPDFTIQSMCLSPATVAVKASEHVSEFSRNLAEQRIQFYQLTALKSDMCLTSTLCASSMSSVSEIVPPVYKVIQPVKVVERKRLVKHLSSSFVVKEDSAMLEDKTKLVSFITQDRDINAIRPEVQRFVGFFYEHLCNFFDGASQIQHIAPSQRDGFGTNPFDVVHLAVEEALEQGVVPVKTLLQVMQGFKLPENFPGFMVEWEAELERLRNLDPSMDVLDLNQPRAAWTPLDASSLYEIYSNIPILSPGEAVGSSDAGASESNQRSVMLGSIACDLYISLHAVGHRSTVATDFQQPSFSSTAYQADGLDNMTVDNQIESYRESFFRSQSPASAASSQMSRPGDAEEEDPAMALLRSYTGTGKFIPKRGSGLLDKWQVGASLADYVFDLDRTTETTPGMLKRAKQLARESRKRRRAASLLQMSQQPELLSTQPAPNTHFFSSQISQPVGRFSQSQQIHSDPPHTMSQPLGGIFGQRPERPKKKAKKRKGGF
ncbi:RNA polymerase I-specific transcription initiation factor RRN6-like protein [Biscogniauxia mediterranea]|nr:RNA polymerase I-specific transcription initiation factor RRN6-like protein [Biscogniauxia mediterranea]